MLTLEQVNQLKAYKELPVKDQAMIAGQIANLEVMRIQNNIPSSETMLEYLAATGHFEIALACYSAQILKQEWA